MEQLERGTVPWQQPWNYAAGLPRNLFSQKPYRGINVWVLVSAGYALPYWLTYKQAQEIGGFVQTGQHGYPVVFWKWLDRQEESQDGEQADSHSRRVPVARLYTVFNIQQCELPERLVSLLKIDNALGADSPQQSRHSRAAGSR
jgi:antirestriction protein ArdC